ncbi:hypothetical protein TNCV_1001751 [Trichonephila clavipes]|nr:hypothetical protein TNCV_1001751 [Trichonephila clavipes]
MAKRDGGQHEKEPKTGEGRGNKRRQSQPGRDVGGAKHETGRNGQNDKRHGRERTEAGAAKEGNKESEQNKISMSIPGPTNETSQKLEAEAAGLDEKIRVLEGNMLEFLPCPVPLCAHNFKYNKNNKKRAAEPIIRPSKLTAKINDNKLDVEDFKIPRKTAKTLNTANDDVEDVTPAAPKVKPVMMKLFPEYNLILQDIHLTHPTATNTHATWPPPLNAPSSLSRERVRDNPKKKTKNNDNIQANSAFTIPGLSFAQVTNGINPQQRAARGVEATLVALTPSDQEPFLVASIYAPSGPNYRNLGADLDSIFKIFKSAFLAGDFNAKHTSWGCNYSDPRDTFLCRKTAVVIPILKPDKNSALAESYRPISLLPVLSKLAEKVILARLNDHLERENILIPEQHGFRPRLSTSINFSESLNLLRKETTKMNARPRSSLIFKKPLIEYGILAYSLN